jgi:hypothetical protein
VSCCSHLSILCLAELHVNIVLDWSLRVSKDKVNLSPVPIVEKDQDEYYLDGDPGNNQAERFEEVKGILLFPALHI